MKRPAFLFQKSHWINRCLFCLMLVLLIQPVTQAQADMGPKPKMDFEFEYQITPVNIVSGELIECVDKDCTESAPLTQVGPQYFKCTENSCSSQSYGYRKYHKLILKFSDRERESNIFETATAYHVVVTEEGLNVQAKRAPFPGKGCLSGGLITLVIEWLVASLYLLVFRLPRSLAGWFPFLSLFTLPAVWWIFPALPVSGGASTGLAEGFAILTEGFLFAWLGRTRISISQSLWLSLFANGSSFLLGLWLG